MTFILCLITSNFISSVKAKCVGKFINPVSDVCWKCIFPITIMGMKVQGGGGPDTSSPKSPLCVCKRPPLPVPIPGIPLSFWEPVRLVDVTRTPYCLVSMGGIKIGDTGVRGHGDVRYEKGGHKHSFYQIHWYMYPIIYWLELLMDFICLEQHSIDLMYLTELDPFWNDDEKSIFLNPEALLLGTPPAQMACAADCVASSVHLPLDPLFWCNGCQGSLYPFTGTINDHTGGVQASLLLVGRMMAKLHRELLLWGYMGKDGLCGKYVMPIMRKSQYRTQMVYPIPQTTACQPLGATELIWQAGREYPYQGSDFSYLIWRKRDCCAF